MPKKLMITIGREHGTMGREVAKMLAEELNIPLYDKEIILDQVRGTQDFEELNAFYNDRQTNSLLYAIAMSEDIGNVGDVPFQMIRQLVEAEGGILMDSCGNYMFRDRENVVSIFLHADQETKARALMKREGITKKKALAEMEEEDGKRYEFHRYYTKETWGMSNGYELCLDTGILGLEGCKEAILAYLKVRSII